MTSLMDLPIGAFTTGRAPRAVAASAAVWRADEQHNRNDHEQANGPAAVWALLLCAGLQSTGRHLLRLSLKQEQFCTDPIWLMVLSLTTCPSEG